MDTGKVYFDSEGNECSILQMVKHEPAWAAARIQEGEKAIDEITALRQQLAATKAESEALRVRVAELSEALQVAVDSPELGGGTWYDMAVVALAERAGGEHG